MSRKPRTPTPAQLELAKSQPYNRSCGVRGCSMRPEQSTLPYCPPHHRAVVLEGDDPRRLRHADQREGDRQCQATGLWDGANACGLVEGHVGPHENCYGSRFKPEMWGTRREAGEYIAAMYSRLPRHGRRK